MQIFTNFCRTLTPGYCRLSFNCKTSFSLLLATNRNSRFCRYLSVAKPWNIEQDDVWDDSIVTMHGMYRQRISSVVKSLFVKSDANGLSIEDCRSLRASLIEQYSKSQRFADATVLVSCFENRTFLDLGVAYVRYLLQENLFNPASVRLGGELLFKAHVQRVPSLCVDKSVFGAFIKMIDATFVDLSVDLMLLPKFLVELCTDCWKTTLEKHLFGAKAPLKLSKMANFSAAIICFHNDEPDLAFSVLERFVAEDKKHVLTKSVHDAMFSCIQRLIEGNSTDDRRQRSVELFSSFIDASRLYDLHGLHPYYVDVVKQIAESWKNYTVSETTVDEAGCCKTCNEVLEKETITLDESIHLERVIYEILKGKDVYRQTTPEELMAFIRFVDRSKPFDLVVDGLNIAYRYGRVSSPAVRVDKLTEAVGLLRERGYSNILVIAKRHLFRNLSDKLSTLNLLAKTFLCKNESVDDLFLLYAAASSGPNCYVVSGDCFSFLHDNKKLTFLIDRWKRTRLVTSVGESAFVVPNFEFPPKYKLRLQRSPDAFHLPLVSPDKNLVGLPHFTQCSWLCVRRNAL